MSPNEGDERSNASSAGVDIGSSVFAVPALSIGDNSGNFPLNLQRDRFASSSVSFQRDLLREITDELVMNCLSRVRKSGKSQLPSYEGFAKRNFVKSKIDEPFWFLCKDGIILNQNAFISAYEPIAFFNRIGGFPKPEYHSLNPYPGLTLDPFRTMLERLPDRWMYSSDRSGYLRKLHGNGGNLSPGTYVYRKLMANAMCGDDFRFLTEISSNCTSFASERVVELTTKGRKKDTRTMKLLKTELLSFKEDDLQNWWIRSSGEAFEPFQLRDWRSQFDVWASSPCVVSMHALSHAGSLVCGDADRVVFDRWMELVGRPYFPVEVAELEEVGDKVRKVLGEKY